MHCSPPTAIVTLGPAASAVDPAPPNTSNAAARATPAMRRDMASAGKASGIDINFLQIFSSAADDTIPAAGSRTHPGRRILSQLGGDPAAGGNRSAGVGVRSSDRHVMMTRTALALLLL